ncbi:MAG: sodium ion-translocating decarboxylase subunit beta [Ruminococcaceae bacterium]|nr:sodium ion-translocating decarboxylase subunit beta [Oscillospiraceae bacterium]
MTEVDLTVEQEQYMAKIENIFAPVATPAEAVMNFLDQTGFMALARNWKMIVMLLISFVLMYLAIVKKFEPLLLLPIAFGMMLTNLPGADMFHEELFADGHVHWELFNASNAITPGLIDILYLGVKLGIYPCLIFLGVGAMTDFGPLIANPKSLLLGAAAQLGIFMTYVAASSLFGFNPAESGSIGIIGGADGPTAIFVTSKLAPHLLGPIAVAAYSYMALVPVIQPPIMKLLTTKKERQIVMKPLREVSKTEKIVFPIAITVFVTLLVPSAGPLVGCLMLGNLARECGVVDRISKTAQNELMNIVTIFLGISVGATATAGTFLQIRTLAIIAMGVVAFGCGTAGGVLLAKLMNLFLKKNKINPLIGSAGVSAVPMAARVSQVVGQKENPQNFLLMHAMGPNVAGVIGSAIAAGVLIALFG